MNSERRFWWTPAVLLAVVLTLTTACQTGGTPPPDASSSQGDQIVGPLDAAAVTQLKAETTAIAVSTLHLLTATGVDATSVIGQWLSCDDTNPDFGQYSVAARIAVPPGKPEGQLDPLITPLLADGWTVRRDTATSRDSATAGNALALHKGALALEITTTGGRAGLVSLYGRCVNSPVFNNDGFNFDTDKDSIQLG